MFAVILAFACAAAPAFIEPALATTEQGGAAQKPASITASPNPVAAGAGAGKTTITWTTGSDADGEVRVSIAGAPDRLFARGKSGSTVADWIQDDTTYEFRLYTTGSPPIVLARTTVVRIASPKPATPPQPKTRPSIDAAPRIVPASDKPGSTTVTWSTGDGRDGEVRVSINQGPEKTVAKGKTGTISVDWIQGGAAYDFRLYAGQGTSSVATVRVIRAAALPGAAVISASPNPVPAGAGPGETTITWTTGNGAEGRVRVSTDGGLERTVTQGPAGTLPVNWINGSAVYEFRLYAAAAPSTLLAKVSVSRAASTAIPRTPPSIDISRVDTPNASGPPRYRITWTTGDRSDGILNVSANGNPPDVLGRGPVGAEVINWLLDTRTYEFTLYSAASKALLASASVKASASGSAAAPLEPLSPEKAAAVRSRSFLTATPNPVPGGWGAGNAKVSWNLDSLDHGRVTVAVNGAPEVEIGAGASGTTTLPDVRAGSTYELRLYGGEPKVLILSATVTRNSAPPWMVPGGGMMMIVIIVIAVARRRRAQRRASSGS